LKFIERHLDAVPFALQFVELGNAPILSGELDCEDGFA
jgi:hypothetical protein